MADDVGERLPRDAVRRDLDRRGQPVDAVRLVREGKAPRIPQDESQATYDPLCRDEHAAFDWGRPASEVSRMARSRGTSTRNGTPSRSAS